MTSSMDEEITINPPATSDEDPQAEERLGFVREVGAQAVWSLSSCKPGFGVERLRDNIMDTYWQSDGQLPHLVNIQFHKRTNISQIYIYTDYKLDESYTPSRISIRSGTNFNDLQELQVMDLAEPTGWVQVPIKDGNVKSIRTFMLQIAVISNHQNGRDTHMRQIRIHAPVEGKHYPLELFGKFGTVDFQKFATIR
ncbi:anaphase-promoting complex subunit 10 [Drosophila guanche]|uniref:Anaphase-promoting complex subunit 10 n=1 Tax=Drosophila guanche TaxID=7266 RepID=A0A3B0J1Y4_DROGU|nr:anaphase-promoting complex subunit 10 [Drosophila guanche]SPP75334.1 blast:Anaphase-promoting complex subunit 10 [Drosophila guanche]